jgi:two-component system, NarL family, sensor histidine kinase BarA
MTNDSDKIFDWHATLKLNKDNVTFAKEILKMFLTHLAESQVLINQYYIAGDKPEFCAQLHKLYGGCCYCIVPKLAASVKQLEMALKTQDLSKVANLLAAVNQEITMLQDAATANQLIPN